MRRSQTPTHMKVFWATCPFLLFGLSLAALCSTHSVLLFTGFKVHRKYAIGFFPLHIEHYVVLTKCRKGEVIFSSSIRSNTSSDEFSALFCTDSPRAVATAANPGSIKWHLLNIGNFIPKSGKVGILQTLQSSKMFSFLKRLSTSPRLKQIFHWYEDMTLDSNTSSCFRMARRKRYALSNLVLFLPTTFVGVLFSTEQGGEGDLYTTRRDAGSCTSDLIGEGGQKSGETEVSLSKQFSYDARKLATGGYIRGPGAPENAEFLAAFLQPRRRQQEEDPEAGDESMDKRTGSQNVKMGITETMGVAAKTDEPKPRSHSEQKAPEMDRIQPSVSETRSNPESVWVEQESNTHIPEKISPLCPLVADDYASHWLSLSLSSAQIIYHVPYLKSPSYWDPRFPKMEDKYPQSWKSEVVVREGYTYNSSESAIVSAALATTLETLHTKLKSIGPRFSRMMMYKLTMLARLDVGLVSVLLLSSIDKEKGIPVIQALQGVWEESGV